MSWLGTAALHIGAAARDVTRRWAGWAPPAKTMSDPYGHVVDEIRVKTRDFR